MREVSLLLFENQCFPKNRVKLISLLFLFAIISCKGQNFNIHTMKYFDEKEFESWDFDTRYPFDDELKYLKKGNKRLEILYSYKDKEVQIKEYDTITNYYQWTTYNLETKAQIQTGRTFFNIDYGIWYFYSKTGKLEEKVDMDKDYKFSIFQLIGKIKKEYMRYDTNPNEHGFCTCFSFVDRIIFPNELLFPPQKINFEGEEFYAPAKLEEYLTLMYGDYNQLPPVEDRVGHRPVEVSVTEELFTR